MKLLLIALLPALAMGQLVTGGVSGTTMSPTEEPVVFAVQAINDHLADEQAAGLSGDGHSQTLTLVDIVNARVQVVAGWKYYLTLHMTEGYYCDVTVWFRDWLQAPDRLQTLDGPTCRQHHAAARAGSVSDVRPLPSQSGDGESGVLHRALEFVACAYNDRVNDASYASKLGDTSGVTYTEQLTAGMTYRFYNVPMVATTCHLAACDSLDLTACHVRGGDSTKTCDVEVQYQSWMDPAYTVNSITC